MTWSFSRISAFKDCPYRFLLHYIFSVDEEDLFFASYGSFVHRLLASFYNGLLTASECLAKYITDFRSEVSGRPPSEQIYRNYFTQGLRYFSTLPEVSETVIGVEQYVTFTVGGYPFQGFVDLITKDANGLVRITDHKSRDLKTRSKRALHGKGETETDRTLNTYLRQLYLYNEAIKSSFHANASLLTFNCFRTGTVITEPYREEAAKEAKDWAVKTIEKINSERDWRPKLNPFTCKHICGVHRECEYYQLSGGRIET